ncbi:predicted protein [Botrytis cinerea T4]|uniref:Uncharacterized protein n=1 Tax=Botryotinia fuckeliana (strain T4) TaxID=999810 RepID=G2YIQ5_BOTF4|nr:predicted protein [Botrytis cinerea T4]
MQLSGANRNGEHKVEVWKNPPPTEQQMHQLDRLQRRDAG